MTRNILLSDIINIDKKNIDLKKVKIRLNQNNHFEDPIYVYQNNPKNIIDWTLWRDNHRVVHQDEYIISLVKVPQYEDAWLMTHFLYTTKNIDVNYGVGCEYVELNDFEQFYGRLILSFHRTKSEQWSSLPYAKYKTKFIVNQILPSIYDGIDFPGYDKVLLNYNELETIIKCKKIDWVNALSNQKAVYLITDKSNGKHYVGSATSKNGMLLRRWSDYVNCGHGGNEGLIKVVEQYGLDHIRKNFTYSIIENYNSKVDDSVILEREYWWINALKSREHGYNENGAI